MKVLVDKIEEYTHINQLLAKSTQVVWVKENDKVNLVRYPMKKFGNNVMTQVDVAFPIVHGTNVEDGTLQGFLATLGLPVVGCDVLSSAVGMNKYVMKTVLKDNDIPVLILLKELQGDFPLLPLREFRSDSLLHGPACLRSYTLQIGIGLPVGRGLMFDLLIYDHLCPFVKLLTWCYIDLGLTDIAPDFYESLRRALEERIDQVFPT